MTGTKKLDQKIMAVSPKSLALQAYIETGLAPLENGRYNLNDFEAFWKKYEDMLSVGAYACDSLTVASSNNLALLDSKVKKAIHSAILHALLGSVTFFAIVLILQEILL